jgi:hypothetical protein
MKVTFYKSIDRGYKPSVKRPPRPGMFTMPTVRFSKDEMDCLNEKLKELVISINIDSGVSYAVNEKSYSALYTFTDPADEAFFLVWSSDGIEI